MGPGWGEELCLWFLGAYLPLLPQAEPYWIVTSTLQVARSFCILVLILSFRDRFPFSSFCSIELREVWHSSFDRREVWEGENREDRDAPRVS